MKLQEYPWYGNIRELQHAVERAVILCEGETLSDSDFLLSTPTENTPEDISTLEEMEINLIRRTIELTDGNLSQVASRLGITRQTLYNKIKKYGL